MNGPDRNLTEQLLRLKAGMTLTAQRTDDGEVIVVTLEHHGPHERITVSRGLDMARLQPAQADFAALEFDHLLAELAEMDPK